MTWKDIQVPFCLLRRTNTQKDASTNVSNNDYTALKAPSGQKEDILLAAEANS